MSAPEIPAPEAIISAARSWVGTPYHHQASKKGVGCDCIGLIAGVWREVYGAPHRPIPPYSPDWGDADGNEHLLTTARAHFDEAPIAGIETGSVVALRWRKGGPAKHCGIIGAGTLIHAYEKKGVVEVGLGRLEENIVAAFRWRAMHRVTA